MKNTLTPSFRSLQKLVHENAVSKGWWEPIPNKYSVEGMRERSLPELIALMHSELSEALEEIRKPDARPFYLVDGKPEGWAVELADTVIRIMDTCEHYEQDLQALIEMKMKYNEGRSYKHGGKVL